MLDHGDTEHLRGRCTVNIATLFKGVDTPLLPGEPGKHSGFDCGKVSHNEPTARFRNEGGTDQLRKHPRGGIVQQINQVELLIFNEVTGKVQILDMVLGKVLDLHQSAGPSARSVRSIKLEQSMNSTIRADRAFNGFILFHRGLCHQKPELQHLQHFTI